MVSPINGFGNNPLPPLAPASSQTSAARPAGAGSPDWFSASSVETTSRQIITATPEFPVDTPPSDLSRQILAHIGEPSDL